MNWCGSNAFGHRVGKCKECQRLYQANRRKQHPEYVRPPVLGPRKPPWTPSPLNLRTSAKYAKCQERGGCIPSEVYVIRSFPLGTVELPECKRCKVPVRGKGRAMVQKWNGAAA